MNRFKRKEFISETVQKKGKIEINDLSDKLKVSPMTIRRDLAELEGKTSMQPILINY